MARAHLRGSGTAGVVFFLPAPGAAGAVAVGAAHSFDRTLLAESGELEFRLGAGGGAVAVARRYFTPPGRSFREPAATLREDFVTFVLEEPPSGVRILDPAPRLPRPGEGVRILGIPSSGDAAQSELFGRVVASDVTRIEVELDAWADLRGWGGAPVLAAKGGRVVGLLQAVWSPDAERLRTGVGPIGGVVAALARPYEGGLGRLFATLAPPPSAATDPARRRRAATGSPFGDQAARRSRAEVDAALGRAEAAQRALPTPALRLEIEHPRPGSVVGDAAGVFLAGRAVALAGARRRFDIVIAIDTSLSTSAPTGVDVDGDGLVGSPLADPQAGATRSSDAGDSILAAELAAAAKLLDGLDPRSTRVALLTFAGDPEPIGSARATGPSVRRAALTHVPLTSDYRRLRRALDALGRRGSRGMTHMAAGVDQATLELLGLPGSLSGVDPESEKVVLFLTDGQPTLPHPSSEAGNVRAVLEAAQRARRAGVRIHSFAIGPEALAGPIAAVEMASVTDGAFVPVRDPGSLVRFVETVSFANIEEISVANVTSRQSAHQVRVHADGSWDALVPLVAGENRLEVRARSTDGAEAAVEAVVRHAPGAANPPVPVELVSKHNELLETRLAALRWERAEVVRRELILEIDRERAAALERAARQRKELELEAVRPDGG